MVNYTNSKIYKIECLSSTDANDIYIGSTTKDRLCQRMDTHRTGYKRWLNGKGSHIRSYDLFKKYGIDNCRITLIEAYPCESRDALQAREGHYQRQMICINNRIEGRTGKQYREVNKDKINEYQREYQKVNKEEIREQKTVKFTCDCGATFQKTEKARHERTIKHIKYIESKLEIVV